MKGIKFLTFFLLSAINFCFMQSCSTQNQKTDQDKKEDSILVLNNHKVLLKGITEIEYKKTAKLEQINPDTILVTKIKGDLALDLANNSKIVLKDSLANTDNTEQVTYTYIGYFKDAGFYVIKAQFFETSEYLLINYKTGDKTKIWGKPKLSPNKEYIVASSNSLGYDIMPNGIQMWSIKNSELKLEWEYKQEQWECDEILWANNDTIYFIKRIPDFISKTSKEEKYYAALTMK